MRLRQITQIIALLAAATILSATPASAQSWPNGNQTQVSQQGQLSLTQPPIIEYADPHTVTVMWQTDQNATGVLRWGADPSNLSMGAQQDDRSRTHRIRVMNQFQPNSTYYFQVLSQSNNGQVVSPVMSFTTPSNGQVVRQQQPNIVGGPYGDQNAQGSYGQGPYGQPNGGYGLPQSSGPVAAGNSQITQGPIVEYADQHSATIMFQTAGDTNGGINVRFGNDPNNLTQVARVGGYGNPYRVQILNAFQAGQTGAGVLVGVTGNRRHVIVGAAAFVKGEEQDGIRPRRAGHERVDDVGNLRLAGENRLARARMLIAMAEIGFNIRERR